MGGCCWLLLLLFAILADGVVIITCVAFATAVATMAGCDIIAAGVRVVVSSLVEVVMMTLLVIGVGG